MLTYKKYLKCLDSQKNVHYLEVSIRGGFTVYFYYLCIHLSYFNMDYIKHSEAMKNE